MAAYYREPWNGLERRGVDRRQWNRLERRASDSRFPGLRAAVMRVYTALGRLLDVLE